MTKIVKSRKVIGGIVGRFQVHELSRGHIHLFKQVLARHQKIIIFLGCRRGMATKPDPLNFDLRVMMLKLCLGKLCRRMTFAPIYDQYSNSVWSRKLDEQIEEQIPGKQVILYGSRMSFIPKYKGKFETVELKSIKSPSGTMLRDALAKINKGSREFLAGVIYSVMTRYDLVYPTVDVAIINRKAHMVLLGRKDKDMGRLRFPGGFIDVEDKSAEDACLRERGEEVKRIVVAKPVYIGTAKIDDERYRGTGDGIMTTFYSVEFVRGKPSHGDDLNGIEWVRYEDITKKIVRTHRPLVKMLLLKLRAEGEIK